MPHSFTTAATAATATTIAASYWAVSQRDWPLLSDETERLSHSIYQVLIVCVPGASHALSHLIIPTAL